MATCKSPGQLPSTYFQTQTSQNPSNPSTQFNFCNSGTVSFENVIGSSQTIYSASTKISDSKYFAIPYMIRSLQPSNFSLILSSQPIQNNNFIGSDDTTPFTYFPETSKYASDFFVRINLMGGSSMQYTQNSILETFGNYISVVDNGNDQGFVPDTTTYTNFVPISSSYNYLTTNAPLVLYFKFYSDSTDSTRTNLVVNFQNKNNDVDLYNTNSPITATTQPLVLNYSIGQLGQAYVYVAVSQNNYILLNDWGVTQGDAICPQYSPGIGGGSEYQLLNLNTVTSSSSNISAGFSSSSSLNYLSNRFQGYINLLGNNKSNICVNLLVTNLTSSNIEFTSCGNTANPIAEKILRLVLGQAQETLSSNSNLTAPYMLLTDGNSTVSNGNGNGNYLEINSWKDLIPSVNGYCFDIVVLEPMITQQQGSVSAYVKIAPQTQMPSLFANYTSPVSNTTPITQVIFNLNSNSKGNEINPNSDTVRSGLVNLTNTGSQLSTKFAYNCGMLNREADGVNGVSVDTAFLINQEGDTQQNQYVVFQFNYTPNSTNSTKGTFGFVVQNTSVIQSTCNPSNNYDNYTNLQPNTCFFPALKWVCNYDTTTSSNEWVGVSDGDDGNFVIQPANLFTTSFSQALQGSTSGTVPVTVIFEINLIDKTSLAPNVIPMWTYFGDVTSSSFSNASPFELLANVQQTVDFSSAFSVFQWNQNQNQGTFSSLDSSSSSSSPITVKFETTLDVLNSNYNYLASYVECPNGVNTNICIPNLDPIANTRFDNNIPDFFIAGTYNPLKSAENYSIQNKTTLRNTIQQIGNSAQSTEFYANSPNLCPNGVDFCVPAYVYDANNNSSLNYIVNYTPVPSLYAAEGRAFGPDMIMSQCFENPSQVPKGINYDSCQDYFNAEYSYLSPDVQSMVNSILDGSIKYPLFGAYGPQICSFTGQCSSVAEINAQCLDNTNVDSAIPPFTKSANLDPFLVGYPCASFTNPSPIIQTDPYACGPKSPWDQAYMTRYTCNPSSSTATKPGLVPNQFNALTVPVPAGKGLIPSISAYEICGSDCRSQQSGVLPGNWLATCTATGLANNDKNSLITNIPDADWTGVGTETVDGCFASLRYDDTKVQGTVIGPSICLTNNGSLGLNIGAVGSNELFAPSSVGSFGVFSGFDQENMNYNTFMFRYANDVAPTTPLPTCPYPSPSGPYCSDVFQSFYGWDYAQMFFQQNNNFNPPSNTSFASLPFAQEFMYSTPLPGTCDDLPFPALY